MCHPFLTVFVIGIAIESIEGMVEAFFNRGKYDDAD